MNTSRTELLVGSSGIEKLKGASVAVIGLGGVGGYALEAITRAGVGKITIIDFDRVTESNFNRQILATVSTLGIDKTEAARARVMEINPSVELNIMNLMLDTSTPNMLVDSGIGYAIDAIDSVEAKVHLIKYLYETRIKFISSMGAGSRLHPKMVRIDDISKTSVCPLARSVRKKLKALGITKGVRCVYSTEVPLPAESGATDEKKIPSISYMPGIFGLFAAGVIISDIINS